MADATTKTLIQAPDETDEKPRLFGLSLAQITGSALAAVTTAVAASFFGVAGTLIGAAFGSVVSTVAGAAYATSLQTAAARLRPRTLLVRPGPDGVAGTAQDDPALLPSGLGSEQVPLAEVLATAPVPGPAGAGDPWWSRLRWRPVAAVAALGFVVAVAALSLTESALGHPVSDSAGRGTTLGQVVGTSQDDAPGTEEPVTPDPSGSATDPAGDPTATDDADPSASPEPSGPAVAPTPTGDPTGDPTTAPTADPTSPSDPAGPSTDAPPAGGAASPAPTGGVTP